MFLRVEMSIIKNTTFDYHAVSRNFSEICVPFESVYFFIKRQFLSPVAVVFALYYTVLKVNITGKYQSYS